MQALLIDLDGVLYVGGEPVPGASDAMSWLAEHDVPHLFLTNTTSKPRRALVERLDAMGVHTEPARILTPPVAAVRWLREHAPGPVALFVPEATANEFAELPLLADDAESGAASVVVGDLGAAWDFPTLNRAFRLLMAEPRPQLVALGMTRYWRAADGLRLDVAPFVVGLEHATGCRAAVLGKPAAPFFETALGLLGRPASDVVMVGDDVVGDVGGAQKLGIFGLLVRTGKFRPGDLERDIVPDAVLGSIADLPAWWEKSAASETST
jgi:HAD superfamily hydrolase (TIGR01458 family)